MIGAPRGRMLAVIGVAGYLLFVLATFPAHLASRWLAPEVVILGATSGTIWSGRAETIAVGRLELGSTSWRFRPLSLLRLRAGLDIETRFEGGAIRARFEASPLGNAWLRDVAGVMPVGMLATALPTGMVDGRIGLDIASAEIANDWIVDAQGTVDLVEMKLISPVEEQLGSFAIVFAGAGEQSLDADISDTSGPLTVGGKLVLHNDRRWELDANVAPNASASARLRQNLAMLGPRDAQGRYRLSYSDTL